MMRNHRAALLVLFLTLDLALAQEMQKQESRNVHTIEPRDSFKVWNRERNAHACIMSIVFIVLYPLGAISIRLPIHQIPYLRNTYLQNKVMAMHVPIQLLAFVMMIGGMALGIRVAQFLGYIHHPVRAHVVIGLLAVCTIILFQPALGVLQHRTFKRTGRKSKFAYVHRWIGRVAIILGMINTGLGFQLAKKNVIIHTHTYVREYVLLGILVTAWVFFVLYDEFRVRRSAAVPDGEKGGQQQEPKR